MTTQIAFDKSTNDIILSPTGIERVDKGRYVVQLVQARLRTSLGEWRLNTDLGWLNLDDFKRNPDLFDIEFRAKEIILSTTDVKSVESMSLELVDRILHLSFTAKTTYGLIDLTIPWGI